MALFQPQPGGLGLFLRPAALYEIHPCISPLRGQLRCSNGFQTHLSIAHVGWVHRALSALPDTNLCPARRKERGVPILHERLTNGSGTHLNSEAGREAVKYRDVFHTTQPGAKIVPALRVAAEKAPLMSMDGRYAGAPGRRAPVCVTPRLFRITKRLSSRLD